MSDFVGTRKVVEQSEQTTRQRRQRRRRRRRRRVDCGVGSRRAASRPYRRRVVRAVSRHRIVVLGRRRRLHPRDQESIRSERGRLLQMRKHACEIRGVASPHTTF